MFKDLLLNILIQSYVRKTDFNNNILKGMLERNIIKHSLKGYEGNIIRES